MLYFVSKCSILSRMSFLKFVIGSFICLFTIRALTFLLIFVILGISAASVDVLLYYYGAKSVLSGLIPYLDFNSSYSILFPYLCAFPVLIWNSPKSIILFSIFIEFLSFLTWIFIAKKIFKDDVIRFATIMYICNPFPFVNVGIKGYNQIWIAFLCGISLSLLLKGKEILGFLIFVFTLFSTKLLALLYLPSLLFMAKRKKLMIFLISFLVIILTVLLKSFGIDLLQPLKIEINLFTSGNIPFLLNIFPLFRSNVRNHLFLAILVICLFLIIIRLFWKPFLSGRKEISIHLVSVISLIFMLFSFKSYAHYLVMCFYPLCLSVASFVEECKNKRQEIILFGIFSLIATLEPSLWHRWILANNFDALGKNQLFPSFGKQFLFFGLEVILVMFYGYYLIKIMKFSFRQINNASKI